MVPRRINYIKYVFCSTKMTDQGSRVYVLRIFVSDQTSYGWTSSGCQQRRPLDTVGTVHLVSATRIKQVH